MELQFLTPSRVVFIVICNLVSADRSVMAASRLLGAAAACVTLLSFAAGHGKSYWNGFIKVAKVICQQIFSILALAIFLLQFLSKSASKSSFFLLAPRSSFGAAISDTSVQKMLKLLCVKASVCKSFRV